ncbi:MAG: cobalamin biosynthesis protein P47K [Deltaproteobacteria bacterium]|nr:cobalamin biosynthesis protein P47K [Deltaproteobacteria bacterium]
MHLLVVTGFLGSGKTTLLLRLAELARGSERKVAILVNEIGEIGIDNQLMRRLGHNVWELLGGCICCSLAGDVIGTLERVKADFDPDLVLLEPTGAADPRNLMNVLNTYHGVYFKSLIRVALLDPLRLTMLMVVLSPLITTTVQQADLVLVNKADVASPEEMAFAFETISRLSPSVPVDTLCARDAIEPRIIRKLLPWMR